MSRASFYGNFAGSAINPLNIFAVFSIFFNIDFYVFWLNGRTDIFEEHIVFSTNDILYAYAVYSFLFLMALGGLTLAFLLKPYRSVPAELSQKNYDKSLLSERKLKGSVGLFLVFVASAIAMIALTDAVSDWHSGRSTRELFFRGNKLVQIAVSAVCPTLAIYLSLRKPWRAPAVFAVLGSLGVLSATGSRGVLILVLLIWAVALVVHGIRISSLWYLVVIPVLSVFLSVSRYFLREAWRYDTYSEFVEDRGGYFQLFFGTVEIGMAEALSTIVIRANAFNRAPFESFLGLLIYPLPRSVFEFKPWGASSYFTQEMSPVRWYWTKSEILTTGYGDLILQFGLVGATAAVFLLAFLWHRGCMRIINGLPNRIIVWLPFLIWWMYIFVRGDVFNIGNTLWPFLVVIIGFKLIDQIRFRNTQTPMF